VERSLIGPDAKVYTATAGGVRRLKELATRPYQPPARWQEADFVAWLVLLGPIEPTAVTDTIDRELMLRR
jgi:DNA-binding PadR family transcriptional regulator